MNDDISEILTRWPHDHNGGLQVRRVQSRDGKTRLQLRIDLGLMQMEATGRPDGRRPHGEATLLDYHRNQAEAHREKFGWYEGFELDSEDCAALRQEATQFYHRRIAFLELQDFRSAVADADHNLLILDLLKAFAKEREDWLTSEQFRAFIWSHRIQALVYQHLAREDVRAALLELDRGLRRLKQVFAEQERLDEYEDSSELTVLTDLRRRLEARYQITHRQRLHILLDDALRREDPEAAADLRAQLRQIEE